MKDVLKKTGKVGDIDWDIFRSKNIPDEQLEKVAKDVAENEDLANALIDDPNLVDAWKKLDDLGDDVTGTLRKDHDALEKIDDFDNGTDGNFDDIKDELKNLPEIEKKAWVNHLEKRTVNGKVLKSGDNFDKYNTFNSKTDVPSRYSNDPRFDELSKDPAHTGGPNEISPNTRREAMAGLEAESQNLVKGPISRDPSGVAEFIDADGNYLDVKAPPSVGLQTPSQIGAAGNSIKVELLSPNTKVILDCTWMNETQLQELRSWLQTNLNQSEISRIVEVNSNIL